MKKPNTTLQPIIIVHVLASDASGGKPSFVRIEFSEDAHTLYLPVSTRPVLQIPNFAFTGKLNFFRPIARLPFHPAVGN